MGAKTDTQLEAKSVIERKAEIIDRDDTQGIVECIVSVFSVEDYGGDVMERGCFKESLQRKLPKGIWMHDGTKPVARTLEARELAPNDARLPDHLKPYGGLYIKAQFNLETERGRDAFSDIKFGIIDEFSIGFFADQKTLRVVNNVRYIKKAWLVEWSPVLMGMNPHTAVLAVKEHNMQLETKGQYLGEYIEQRAAMSACETVMNAMFWRIYQAVFAEDKTLEEKLAQVAGICDEASKLFVEIIENILRTATDEELETAGATLKTFFVDPSASVAPRTGQRLKAQVDLVLTANQQMAERLKSLAQWKAANRAGEQSHVLSEANREYLQAQLATLKEVMTASEQLLAVTQPLETKAESGAAMAAYLKTLAARLAIAPTA